MSPGASLNQAILFKKEKYSQEIVNTTTLDDYFPISQTISALKIDVEGSEMDVFKGTTRILKESKPFIIFECENRHLINTSVEDAFKFLLTLGYTGYFVFRNSLISINKFNSEIHQKQSSDRYWDNKNYVNNFAFYHPNKSD